MSKKRMSVHVVHIMRKYENCLIEKEIITKNNVSKKGGGRVRGNSVRPESWRTSNHGGIGCHWKQQ